LSFLPFVELAQESIQFIHHKKPHPCKRRKDAAPITQEIKITRGLDFANPNNLLALRSVTHPAI
jgi:hypothetical protein